MRTDLKKVLKCMYKKAEQYEFIEFDKKIYVLSILSGVIFSKTRILKTKSPRFPNFDNSSVPSVGLPFN